MLSVHYVKKSQYMLVNKNNNTRINDEFKLVMGNHIIARTNCYRYLGLLVDEKFCWADHINEVCTKLSQVAGTLFKIRKLLSKQALMLIYHSLVGSKLRYGLVCWATAKKFLLDKVHKMHNKIVTCLTFKKRCNELWPLYQQLKVLPLKILIKIEHGKTMYKFRNKMLPQVFNTYFETPPHLYFTRFSSNNNFAMSSISTVKEEALLRYIGPKTWLSIPFHIRDSLSLKVFVKMYRNHLIGNIDTVNDSF